MQIALHEETRALALRRYCFDQPLMLAEPAALPSRPRLVEDEAFSSGSSLRALVILFRKPLESRRGFAVQRSNQLHQDQIAIRIAGLGHSPFT